MAHHYLYVKCKTFGCPSDLNVTHIEAPDVPYFEIEYPDEALHFSTRCPLCNEVHPYLPEDVKSKSSEKPMHHAGWRPVLPYPHPSTQGNN